MEIRVSQFIWQWIPSCWRSHSKGTTTIRVQLEPWATSKLRLAEWRCCRSATWATSMNVSILHVTGARNNWRWWCQLELQDVQSHSCRRTNSVKALKGNYGLMSNRSQNQMAKAHLLKSHFWLENLIFHADKSKQTCVFAVVQLYKPYHKCCTANKVKHKTRIITLLRCKYTLI